MGRPLTSLMFLKHMSCIPQEHSWLQDSGWKQTSTSQTVTGVNSMTAFHLVLTSSMHILLLICQVLLQDSFQGKKSIRREWSISTRSRMTLILVLTEATILSLQSFRQAVGQAMQSTTMPLETSLRRLSTRVSSRHGLRGNSTGSTQNQC